MLYRFYNFVRLLKLFLLTLACGLYPSVIADSYEADVNVYLNTDRILQLGHMQKSALDRDVYFRCYHMPGLFSDEVSEDLATIGAMPGRGTGPYYAFDKRHSYEPQTPADPNQYDWRQWFVQQNQKYVLMYQKAALRYPGLPHALASNVNYPESMRRVDKNNKPYALRSDQYGAFSDLIAAFYDDLKANHCSIPQWYTSQNEPSWEWGAEAFASYTRTLAVRMAEAHPDVKVCGPCSAWPYPRADWKRWNDWEKRFIEIAGDRIGAYDLHFYSKGYWAYVGDNLGGTADSRKQESASLFESQKCGNAFVWDYGRADGLLDLIAAYHRSYWHAVPRPVIISEFGRQGIHPQLGPWENEFKSWLYMTTVVRLWTSFMERPEVELAVPFILGESDPYYGAARGQTVYTRPNAPDDLTTQVTRFRDFYLFFKDLCGSRLLMQVGHSSSTDSRYLTVRAFRSGQTVYILLHNMKGFPDHPATVSVFPEFFQSDADGRVTVSDFQIKRMRWEGPVPKRHDETSPEGQLRIDTEYQSLSSLTDISMQGEETCLVKMVLSDVPDAIHKLVETVNYADNTLMRVNSEKSSCELTVTVPRWQGTLSYATLYLAFARDGGFKTTPVVRINGTATKDFDMTFSEGVEEFHAPVEIPLIKESVRAGQNRITVTFSNENEAAEATVVSAKIIAGWDNRPPLPRLPRVLLIGDSILMGYTEAVRSRLNGVAEVFRPEANCGSTKVGLRDLEAWLGNKHWDVIHFNFGLHDLRYVFEGDQFSDAEGNYPTRQTGIQRVPLQEYKQNLRTLVARLKKRASVLIWCSTTPIGMDYHGYFKGQEELYNRAAAEIMNEEGVVINDLWRFAAPQLDCIQGPDHIHFTAEGSNVLAEQIVFSVRQVLSAPAAGRR